MLTMQRVDCTAWKRWIVCQVATRLLTASSPHVRFGQPKRDLDGSKLCYSLPPALFAVNPCHSPFDHAAGQHMLLVFTVYVSTAGIALRVLIIVLKNR